MSRRAVSSLHRIATSSEHATHTLRRRACPDAFRSISSTSVAHLSSRRATTLIAPSSSWLASRSSFATESSSLLLSRRWNSSSSLSPSSTSTASSSEDESLASAKEPRLSLTFTCTAPIPASSPLDESTVSTAETCGHRSSHTFTKRAYENGIVIIACPSCKNRHLIADNLGWFKNQDGSEGGRNVEDFVKAKGESIKRGNLQQTAEGDVEYIP